MLVQRLRALFLVLKLGEKVFYSLKEQLLAESVFCAR
jgi:hypothetical protein